MSTDSWRSMDGVVFRLPCPCRSVHSLNSIDSCYCMWMGEEDMGHDPFPPTTVELPVLLPIHVTSLYTSTRHQSLYKYTPPVLIPVHATSPYTNTRHQSLYQYTPPVLIPVQATSPYTKYPPPIYPEQPPSPITLPYP